MKLIHDGDLHNHLGAKQISDADIHSEPIAEPTAEHRDRLSKALKDLHEFHATKGHHGAEFTSASGKAHRVGDKVRVNGMTGRIVRKHPTSGLPEIEWEK
jgi:hypothetical protein